MNKQEIEKELEDIAELIDEGESDMYYGEDIFEVQERLWQELKDLEESVKDQIELKGGKE